MQRNSASDQVDMSQRRTADPSKLCSALSICNKCSKTDAFDDPLLQSPATQAIEELRLIPSELVATVF